MVVNGYGKSKDYESKKKKGGGEGWAVENIRSLGARRPVHRPGGSYIDYPAAGRQRRAGEATAPWSPDT